MERWSDLVTCVCPGHDGAVQEGESVRGAQHPQPQGHREEAGELPEGAYLSILWTLNYFSPVVRLYFVIFDVCV